MDSREKKNKKHPKEQPKEKLTSKKRLTSLLEKRTVKKTRKPPQAIPSSPEPEQAEEADTPVKKQRKSREAGPSGLNPKKEAKRRKFDVDLKPVSLSASSEGRDAISQGNGQSAAVKDYIRNTISLPQMNNAAEELLIDGFALVSFLTKEDLDTFITEKEGESVTDRLKQQFHHRQQQQQPQQSHGLARRKMGEEKSRHGSRRRSLSATREKRSLKPRKMSTQSPKTSIDAEEGSSGSSAGGRDQEQSEATDEFSTEAVRKTATAPTATGDSTDQLDRQTAAHTLSLLSSGGLKQRDLASRLTPTQSKSSLENDTLRDENALRSLREFGQDTLDLNNVKRELEDEKPLLTTRRKSTVVQSDDGAISNSSSQIAGLIGTTERETGDTSRSPTPSHGEAISSPTSSQDASRTAADSSQVHLSGPVISANNAAGAVSAATSGAGTEAGSSVSSVVDRSATEHRHSSHKDKKSSHRDREQRERDRSDRHNRDKEKERDREKERDKSTPRPDSRLSVTSKADNHNPASQRGFNPVVQSQNPLTQHLFSSPPTPLSPPFPSPHHTGGGGGSGNSGGAGGGAASSLFSHLNFQQPNWRMFSPAMMGAGAGGMTAGMPMGLMGPSGFDRSFFGFPQYSPGGPSFSGAGMGNGMSAAAAHSMLSSSMSSPFPPSMSGMNGLPLPNFPGLNSIPPNFQSPQTSSASSTSQLSSSIGGPKKPGKWCAMHVRIAWEIYHHQQRQQQQNANTTEAMKLGDFTKDISLLAKMGPPMSLNLSAPGLTPSYFTRPGAPSDLASSLMPSSLPRLPSQPTMSWPRPPYFGLPSPGTGLGGMSFPANPMMGGRDMLSTNFSPDAWGRRPMAFGGLANPSASLNPVNGAASQSSADRKESLPDKKPTSELPPVEAREKRPVEDGEREYSTSSSKKKRSENHHRSSKSPSINSDKHHSPKEVRPSSDAENLKKRDKADRDDERKRTETPPREGKKSSSVSDATGSLSNSKAIDLRNRSDPVSAAGAPSLPTPPERTKSASISQTASLLSGPSPHPPSFPGESPFPSFMASQLNGSSFDGRHVGSMFPSAPGFPPMWPSSYDPLRPPSLGVDPMMAAQIFQYQQRMRGAGGPMGLHADMFRANPFMQQLNNDRERLNDMAMMRFKTSGFSPGPPGSLFPSQLTSLMRGAGMVDPTSMYSPPVFDAARRSPTPAKSSVDSSIRKDSSSAVTLNGGKDSPTDLSKSRTSSHGQTQSQSGKDSSCSSASSSATKSSKAHLDRSSSSSSSHHRHSPNGETTTATKVDKEKN